MSSILPGLRKGVSKLSRDFFICHHCLKQPRSILRATKFPAKSPASRTIRFNSNAATIIRPTNEASSLSALADSLSASTQTINKVSAKSSFPETSSESVAYWLLGSAASVFGIVIFGGLTRLTESGYVPFGRRSFDAVVHLLDMSVSL